MKLGYSFLLMACASLMFFYSCEDKDDDNKKESSLLTDNEYVNKWIYEQMDEWYFWRDRMPEFNKLNSDLDPKAFFKSLLYSNESRFDGVFFSNLESTHDNLPKAFIAENSSSLSLGFDYIPLRTVLADYPVAFAVIYVSKGTNAAAQGLKRGDVIFKVDGQAITLSNYNTVLSKNASSYTFFISDYGVGKTFDLTVTPTSNYEENPIFLDTVYVEGAKKIGYLVYNQYEFGNSSSRPYDVELAQKLTNFQQKGITDFILDLRYNGGGYVACAQALCSALVPNRNTKNLFEIKTYNSVKQARFDRLPDTNAEKISYMYDYFVDQVIGSGNKSLASIPKLGDQLNSLYVLVTANTASSSELTINALRAYRDVVLVGETTTGKNMGGWALSKDNDPRNTYVISPIIFKSSNKNKESNYASGFTPNIDADDFDLLIDGGLRPLGDKNETLLNAALSSITGTERNAESRSSDVKYTRLPGSSLDHKPNAYKMLDIKKID